MAPFVDAERVTGDRDELVERYPAVARRVEPLEQRAAPAHTLQRPHGLAQRRRCDTFREARERCMGTRATFPRVGERAH